MQENESIARFFLQVDLVRPVVQGVLLDRVHPEKKK